jgi:hypothetical protein
MVNEKVEDFLNYLDFPEKRHSSGPTFHLGKSFQRDELIKRSTGIISGKFSARKHVDVKKISIKKILTTGKLLSMSLSPLERFNFFVLLFNNYFNSHSNTFFSNSAITIKVIAKALNIDKKDYDYTLDFYMNNVPFSDKNDSVFIVSKNCDKLIKSKGANIHFISDRKEIVYLKYFKKFDFFLSKTFLSYRSELSIEELTEIKEINLVMADNYALSGIAFNSFEDLKKAVYELDPFQYIEVEKTEFTPKITLDPDLSIIKMSGNSRPISTTAYFDPVFEWLENYGKHGKKHLNVYLQFHHINTYTMSFLLKMIRILNHYSNDCKNIGIVWVYDNEDDDSREFGEQLRNLFVDKMKFLLIVESDNIGI